MITECSSSAIPVFLCNTSYKAGLLEFLGVCKRKVASDKSHCLLRCFIILKHFLPFCSKGSKGFAKFARLPPTKRKQRPLSLPTGRGREGKGGEGGRGRGKATLKNSVRSKVFHDLLRHTLNFALFRNKGCFVFVLVQSWLWGALRIELGVIMIKPITLK